MKRIETIMEHGGIILIERTTRGQGYVLNGVRLNDQIVRDMINGGWLVEGDSSLRLAS